MATHFAGTNTMAQPMPGSPTPPPRRSAGRIIAIAGGLLVAFLVGIGVGGSNQPTVQTTPAAQAAAPTVTSTVTVPGPTETVRVAAPAPAAIAAAPAPVAAPAPDTSFSSGTYQVGAEIKPGNYKTAGGSTCYWARLKSNDGEFDSIVTNGIVNGPSSMSVKASDKYIEFTGDCTWTKK